MRVLIIDDQIPFLNVLSAMLMLVPDIEAVCAAQGGREGMKFAAELDPDMVLTDYSMPGLDGIGVTRYLKASPRPPKVIMMSFHADPEYREMALKAGADAYLVKSELDKELVPTLKRLANAAAGRAGSLSTGTFAAQTPADQHAERTPSGKG